ncbi:3-oxoacyl-[acyl-carrier protein] reductase [Geodermatophilus amargosae]|uniref:3-oxoacyl-[acyl-carrier protein] reductase n=1 Tax=Geodermatophilus amargosae TaxID=1296565 RepID=A0A1I7B429_9ACTN|nr:hypothetical protein [Geodermatophilus amargosae]SFT81892.1 3-oxoacyl-[acyl-carrier protein] reductase [Geodermatophilus amargosae]
MSRRSEGESSISTGAPGRLVADGARLVIDGRDEEALDDGAVTSLGGSARAPGATGRANSLVDDTGIDPSCGPVIEADLAVGFPVVTTSATALLEGRGAEVATVPLEHLGVPEDIGGVVALPLPAGAAPLTGQTVVIGGVTLTGGVE